MAWETRRLRTESGTRTAAWDGRKRYRQDHSSGAEQGFGDTIQFCRYVPFVVEREGRVIVAVPESLRGLIRRFPRRIISKDQPLTDFDIHCPLLSLPLAFGTRLETIPSTSLICAHPKAM